MIEPESVEVFAFKRGDLVCKVKGYKFDGVVLSAYHMTTGEARYVVEHADRWQHIFSAENLRLRDAQKET